ncbi:methyl-accepting chemotaxis protein [Rhodopseudomonas telluris]|uniref:Methyl-accepting chemotaxis protein n=1 Tax=Rhodopseudomonas telluris TaxID=644215 RepID=A0ABV6EVK5_9BRAD
MPSKLRMTISRRIYLLIGLGFLGLLATSWLASHEIASGLKQQKQIELSHIADLAIAILQDEHDAARRGEISTEDAQKRAQARIAKLRYGGNEYFFITDMQSRMLMHPIAKQLIGQDQTNTKDTNGKLLFREMVDTVRRDGSGYVEYVWPKPGSDQQFPKLSRVAGFAPWGWIVGTGVYIDDLHAQTWSATQRLLIAAAIVLVIITLVSVLVARGITRPIDAITQAMKQLAAGRLEADIPGVGRADEIGEMAGAVEVFKLNAIERQRLQAGQEEAEARAAAQRKADTQRLAGEFERAIGEIVETVSSASHELEASATMLSSTAERSQHLATMVTSASEEASTNVQSVASATEQMSSSVNEISRQVQESARIAHEAVEQAQATNSRVEELARAAARIGDVVELISTIAGQTNLLALNATIEAARAGEAGRGFAVVASEVKALAEQTAKATGEITQQINGIQAATDQSVAAIKEIGGTIGRMSEISSTIASAVEEQGAATQEISRNVSQAAQGTHQVSANITEVQRGATETGSASSQVLSAAKSLSQNSSRLKVEVSKFLDSVRAA